MQLCGKSRRMARGRERGEGIDNIVTRGLQTRQFLIAMATVTIKLWRTILAHCKHTLTSEPLCLCTTTIQLSNKSIQWDSGRREG